MFSGASWDAPENTLAAFELAWERGADAVEGDFYLTADGQIVCIHDRTTARTTDRDLIVAETPLAELQTLDAGTWKGEQWAGERLPTLAEALATVPEGKQFFIELKSGVDIIDALVETVERSGLAAEQIVVIAFDAEVITEVRRRLPDIAANWLVGYKHDEAAGTWSPSLDRVLTTLHRSGASGIGTHANRDVVDETFASALRKRDLGFHTWTVNDLALATHFRELGVDSITTDRPGWLREKLAEATAPREAEAAAN
ncbi:MAG: glycerophosphodiester phosphodiesterase [Phycisphaeraceae bacterium]